MIEGSIAGLMTSTRAKAGTPECRRRSGSSTRTRTRTTRCGRSRSLKRNFGVNSVSGETYSTTAAKGRAVASTRTSARTPGRMPSSSPCGTKTSTYGWVVSATVTAGVPDGRELSGLRRDVDDLARVVGAKHVTREQLLLERELRLRLGDAGSRPGDLLGRARRGEARPAAARATCARRSPRSQVGLGLVELRLGERAVGVELARPLGVRALQGPRWTPRRAGRRPATRCLLARLPASSSARSACAAFASSRRASAVSRSIVSSSLATVLTAGDQVAAANLDASRRARAPRTRRRARRTRRDPGSRRAPAARAGTQGEAGVRSPRAAGRS